MACTVGLGPEQFAHKLHEEWGVDVKNLPHCPLKFDQDIYINLLNNEVQNQYIDYLIFYA